MLCLNRKIGQGIQINDDVTLTILEIRRSSVRIGIAYSENSRVLRQEVYLKIQSGNIEATLPSGDIQETISKILPKKPLSKAPTTDGNTAFAIADEDEEA